MAGVLRKLRAEDPVHYTENELFGGFWSVTRYEDIVQSTQITRLSRQNPPLQLAITVMMCPSSNLLLWTHLSTMRSVQLFNPLAPKNLAQMESLIRTRVSEMFDALPVGEPFDWVSNVSVNLTTQMLATIFGFPFEDRSKLTYWSDYGRCHS